MRKENREWLRNRVLSLLLNSFLIFVTSFQNSCQLLSGMSLSLIWETIFRHSAHFIKCLIGVHFNYFSFSLIFFVLFLVLLLLCFVEISAQFKGHKVLKLSFYPGRPQTEALASSVLALQLHTSIHKSKAHSYIYIYLYYYI